LGADNIGLDRIAVAVLAMATATVTRQRVTTATATTVERTKAASLSESALPPPPFTLSDIKAAIPQECFEKKTVLAIGYMLRDFFFLAVLYALYPHIQGELNPFGITKFIWWNVTGFFMWCLFVVGHDCGRKRQSFHATSSFPAAFH
jgi:hypothetical protein